MITNLKVGMPTPESDGDHVAKTQLDSNTRIVIIGAGVVGAALADDLARVHGMTNVTVVDQGPLYTTGGASSHAPGFAFQTTGSEIMSDLAARTLNKLDGAELDGQWVMKRVGGLELASTPERLSYLQRRYDLARSWGVTAELVDPLRCSEIFPGLNPDQVLGGLHTPTDGVVKSERAVEFQARRAIAHGATFYGLLEVTNIRTVNGAVAGVEVRKVPEVSGIPSRGHDVPEDLDFIAADIVVVCTGMWGPRFGAQLGLELPMVPMEHCESWTGALPGGGVTADVECERPLVRHQESGLYLREYGEGYIWGTYEHRVMPVQQSEIASPEEFARTGIHPAIHPLSRDDLEQTWEQVNRLLPMTEDVAHVGGMNGIFSFTPDGMPLIGDVDAVSGLWLGLSVWLTQSAGVAEILANWIVMGDAGVDTAPLDYRRFDQDHLTPTGSIAWASESRGESYRIAHPRKYSAELRGLAVSPVYERQRELGAMFAQVDGFERALWYQDANARVTGDVTGSWAEFGFSERVNEEARAAMLGAAVADVSDVRVLQLEVAASEMARVFEWSTLPLIGAAVGARLRDVRGGVLGEYRAVRTGVSEFLLLTGSPQDLQRITAALPLAQVKNMSDAYVGLHLMGPASRDVLRELRVDVGEVDAHGATSIDFRGVPARAVLSPLASDHDLLLLVAPRHGLYVWDQLFLADTVVAPVGSEACEVLRITAGVPQHGIDFGAADQVVAHGEYRTSAHQLVQLEIDNSGDPGVVYGQPVRQGDRVVGFVTSAARDARRDVGKAFARVVPSAAAPGSKVQVDALGVRYEAVVCY